jgi:murein L,D-transpeptidase YcbB/YkuD
MAIYPGASFRPLPENETEPLITPSQVIWHSAVSRQRTLFDFFNRPGVHVESHLYVLDDGTAEQYIDTGRQADANYHANARALSVETMDAGNPDLVPWTPAQVERLVDFGVWAHRTHGIPVQMCQAWDAPGFGFHSQFQQWSPVVKTCPGLARRPQVAILLDRIRAVVAGVAEPVTQLATPGTVSTAVHAQMTRPGVAAPRFPLPARWYFGPQAGPRESVSGYYSHRADLATWQRRMHLDRGWQLTVDGLYGKQTGRVATAFQREKGLVPDGLIGAATWAAAWTSPITR